MSYILDALRRADRERRRNAGDPTADVVTLGASAAPGANRLLILLAVIGIAIVALLGANLALRLVGDGHSQTAAPALAAAPAHAVVNETVSGGSPVPETPVLVPADAPLPGQDTTADAPSIETPAPLETLDQLTPAPPRITRAAPRRAKPPRGAPAGGIVTTPAPMAGTGTPLPVTSSNGPAAPAGSSAVTRVVRLSAYERAQLQTTAAPTAPAADLKLMPDDFRASFPQITVQVHVYNADAAKRWAMIDGNRYREGDTLPDGLRIERIVPQGIVFSWQGRQVLYPS